MPSNHTHATDITWQSKLHQELSQSQHRHLPAKELVEYVPQMKDGWYEKYCYYHGVAQGSPLSPTLSTILLIPLLMLTKGIPKVFYADDGLSMPKTKDPVKELMEINPLSGIEAHTVEPKSRWIKKGGRWLNDLKFLGRKFEPKELTPKTEV